MTQFEQHADWESTDRMLAIAEKIVGWMLIASFSALPFILWKDIRWMLG